jgi:hypothetical protein
VSGTGHPSPAFAAAPLRIDQRAQIFKCIGGHEACRDEFPEAILYFTGEPSGRARELGEEGRAAFGKGRMDLLRRRG